jgi:sugar phosphate isomerase/epimerase
MRIRYVVSTTVFWGHEHPLSFEQECQFLKSLGFGIELWPNINGQGECRYEKRNWPRLAAATKDMLVAMRSRDDRPTLEQWSEQIECAKMLNASIVTDLQSLGITEPPLLRYAKQNGGGDGNSFVAELVELAEQNNVKLCIENGHLQALKQVGEKFDSICYCLDTGAANLDGEFSFKQYVDDLAPRTAHLHLTDNYGQTDDRRPPGLSRGIARENWDYLLNTLSKYDNDVVGSFEMRPSMPAIMVRQASDFLFDVLKWPNPPHNQADYANLTYSPI